MQDLGCHDLEFQQLKLIDSMMYTGPGKDVVLHLGVSIRTLERRRNEFNITVSDRIGSRNTYKIISDEQLCSVRGKILEILPDASEIYIIRA